MAKPAASERTVYVGIGAGSASLSSAYHLKKRGLAPYQGFVVLEQPDGSFPAPRADPAGGRAGGAPYR